MTFQYRLADPDDQGVVIEMALAFLAESPFGQVFGADPLRLQLLFQDCLRRGVVVLAEERVTVRGDEHARAVGFIAIMILEEVMSGAPYGEEVAWWVEPDARAHRVGAQLLACAEQWLLTNGATAVKMIAPAGSELDRYYAKQGYVPIETAYLKRLSHEPVQQTAHDADAAERSGVSGAGGDLQPDAGTGTR